ncbi:MAG TPA: type II toxin-antitoxin system VapC family toxin [Vicinamibacteria bacterium]|nr:type II toxin-antitoxin system VapC family toxin [Vicinamibacteria bacterium]
MILDTTVLVDLQRELRHQEPGAATDLLERYADEPVSIAFVTWMEFAEGYEDSRREDCERFLSPFPVLWPDIEVSWEASRIARRLSAEGRAIGDHDAWIGALGLRFDRPVVTRNEEHFRRVEGLDVRSY